MRPLQKWASFTLRSFCPDCPAFAMARVLARRALMLVPATPPYRQLCISASMPAPRRCRFAAAALYSSSAASRDRFTSRRATEVWYGGTE